MNRFEEVDAKIQNIRDYLALREAKGIHVQRVENFAWVTGGLKNYVTLNGVQTECSLLITPEKAYVISPPSEFDRLNAQLPRGVFEIASHDWDQDPKTVASKIVKSRCLQDSEKTADYLKSQRVILNENEQFRLARLGKLAAQALEHGLQQATPDMSEQKLAAVIAYELMVRGVEPVLVIVSGEDNFRSHHNISGQGKTGTICMGIVCAKLEGLVVSLTRMICFRQDVQLTEQMQRNTAIDAAIINATRHSKTLAEAFEKLVKFYGEHELDAEWRKLHQGGIVGYKLKEYFASSSSTVAIQEGMAFAWNITISGTKSEDTFLHQDGKMRWITHAPGTRWPILEHKIDGQTYGRPGILFLGRT